MAADSCPTTNISVQRNSSWDVSNNSACTARNSPLRDFVQAWSLRPKNPRSLSLKPLPRNQLVAKVVRSVARVGEIKMRTKTRRLRMWMTNLTSLLIRRRSRGGCLPLTCLSSATTRTRVKYLSRVSPSFLSYPSTNSSRAFSSKLLRGSQPSLKHPITRT